MSTKEETRGRSGAALIGGGVLMVLCCAVGPAVIGAVAGSAVGGWLGIACAVIAAAAIGLLLHRRTRHDVLRLSGRPARPTRDNNMR